MPLGASVTYGVGSSHGNGYRDTLRQLLVTKGYKIQMMGSRRAGTMENNHNEGWRGYRIDQIFKKARKSVPLYTPDVFTINAGSNDCLQDFYLDHAGERMGGLIQYLWKVAPNSTIILSTLLVNAGQKTELRIRRVNEQYQNLAKKMLDEHRRIILVDMRSADGPQESDLVDGTHPDDNGYNKMAKIWYEGINKAALRHYLHETRSVS
jgi:lysophospholipase L1-like esterase